MKRKVSSQQAKKHNEYSWSTLFKILTMPIAEILLIKKALKSVIRFFLSKLAALIVKQVS